MSYQAYRNLHARLNGLDRACMAHLEEENAPDGSPVTQIYEAVAVLARGCAQSVCDGNMERAMDFLDFAEYLQDVGIRIERKLPSDSRLLDEIVNELDQKRGVGECLTD